MPAIRAAGDEDVPVHVLMNNNRSNYAVINAFDIAALLGAPLARPPEPVLAAMRARDGREPDWLARAPEPRGVMPDPAETGEEDQLSFRI